MRRDAEIRRKLEAADGHLLGDIRLGRDGDRLERAEPWFGWDGRG